jgi:diguanylate cyclase (GGDEF)-like protein/PAS domain S-box-containing protein
MMHSRLIALAVLFLWQLLSQAAFAQQAVNSADRTPIDPTPRHALEVRALTEPDGALQAITVQLAHADATQNFADVALLQLARANACRILAHWQCQRDAAVAAVEAAQSAKAPILEARGQIALARANILLQDFTRAESALTHATLLLKAHPFPLLSGEIQLAYSSLSQGIGKDDLTIHYANQGLGALQGVVGGGAIQTRLLRNRASAYAKQKNYPLARADLVQARALIEQMDDPKLKAEIALETARIAYAQHDVPTQIDSGKVILTLAARLQNSQLAGLGHEVLGLVAQSTGDDANALNELQIAVVSFRALNLRRDELRALRALLQSVSARSDPQVGAKRIAVALQAANNPTTLVARYMDLQAELDIIERAHSADNFEAGLKYAEQELQVARLGEQSHAVQQHAAQMERQKRLIMGTLLMTCALLTLLVVVTLWQRKTQRRLRAAMLSIGESESHFRALSETAQDIVVRMAPDGTREYISPSVTTLLGYETHELIGGRWGLVHPEDEPALRQAITKVLAEGQAASLSYRVLHKAGHYLWLETLARRVPCTMHPGRFEVVYAARDVTARKRAELALAASEHRLQSVADNIPALIAYVDAQLRYQFVNAYSREIFGADPTVALGRTMLEMRGAEAYSEIEPHALRALQGQPSSFEGALSAAGKHYHYQAKFVPDIATDGAVLGFYSVTFDITERKLAELELERLARFDSLTGLANRRQFDERMNLALARCRRSNGALSLLCVDIDHFKDINDSLGHQSGDAVIREFANRLHSCAREEDLVARTGGDEFMVLVEDADDITSAEHIAQRIQRQMQQMIAIADTSRLVSASIGIACVQQPRDADQVITAADQALYAAKHAGRNTYRIAVIDAKIDTPENAPA